TNTAAVIANFTTRLCFFRTAGARFRIGMLRAGADAPGAGAFGAGALLNFPGPAGTFGTSGLCAGAVAAPPGTIRLPWQPGHWNWCPSQSSSQVMCWLQWGQENLMSAIKVRVNCRFRVCFERKAESAGVVLYYIEHRAVNQSRQNKLKQIGDDPERQPEVISGFYPWERPVRSRITVSAAWKPHMP